MTALRVDSVAKHDRYPDVIVATDVTGFQMYYLMTDGVLYPGRPWVCSAQDGHRVHLFLPLPDGPPTVLGVEDCPRAPSMPPGMMP